MKAVLGPLQFFYDLIYFVLFCCILLYIQKYYTELGNIILEYIIIIIKIKGSLILFFVGLPLIYTDLY